jgi:hypothetical protein
MDGYNETSCGAMNPPSLSLRPRDQATTFSMQPCLILQSSAPRFSCHFLYPFPNPKMPSESRTTVASALREKYPRLYTFLYQVLLLVITFFCAIAIIRYGRDRDDPSNPPGSIPGDRNSTTPRLCKYGAREEDADLGPFTVRIIVQFLPHSLTVSPLDNEHILTKRELSHTHPT